MSSADFSNLALRKTVAFNPDGSFINDGYVFTVSSNGRQNWTPDLNLNRLVLSTFSLNSILYVSSSRFDTSNVSSLSVSTASLSTVVASTMYTSAYIYGAQVGSSITTSSLVTPNALASTLVVSTLLTSTAYTSVENVSSLIAANGYISSLQTNNTTTCTIAASTFVFNATSFTYSFISSLSTNQSVNTSTFTGSTVYSINNVASSVTFQTLAGQNSFLNYVTINSTISGSSFRPNEMIVSSGNASSFVANMAFIPSTLKASSLVTSTINITNAMLVSTTLGSTLSMNIINVQSSLTTSSLTVINVLYSTLSGVTMAGSTLQINSTAFASTLTTLNIAYSTLVGSIFSADTITNGSTFVGSTMTIQNMGYSTLLGSSIGATNLSTVNMTMSTLVGSTISSNTMVLQSSLQVSTVGLSTITGSTMSMTMIDMSTLTGSTMSTTALVVASTTIGSTMTMRAIGYSTMFGSTVYANFMQASSIVGSTIAFGNLSFSTLENSTITTNVVFPLLIQGSTISTNTLTVSTLMTVSSSGAMGIGTQTPNYPLTVTSKAFRSMELNFASTSATPFMASGTVYSGTHPSTLFRGEYAIAYGGASTIATTTESQAVGYYAIDVANLGSFGTIASGNQYNAMFYMDPATSYVQSAKFGIGTTAPSYQMTVAQDLSFANMTLNPLNAQLVISGKTNTGTMKFGSYYSYSGGITSFATAIQSSYVTTGMDTGSLLILNPLGGYVGVGITNPAFSLDAGSSGTINAGAMIVTASTTANPSVMQFYSNNNANYIYSGQIRGAGSAAPIYIGNMFNIKTWMAILTSGYVGINTAAPQQMLQIVQDGSSLLNEGQVHSVSIKSSTGANPMQLFLDADIGNNVCSVQSIATGTSVMPFILNPRGGRIGIGTISPSYTLHVVGDSYASGSLLFGAAGTYAAGSIYSDSQWGCVVRAKTAAPTAAEFLFTNAADTHRMVIKTSGYVGIGTDTPSAMLDVNGVINVATDITLSRATRPSIYPTVTNSALQIRSDGTGVLQLNVDGGGSVGVGTTTPVELFSVYGATNSAFGLHNSSSGYFQVGLASSGGNYSTSAGTGDSVIRTISGNLMFQYGAGAAAIYINSSNNVGINTSSPGYQLDINGSARVNGTLYFATPAGDPAANITCRTVPSGQGALSERSELILFQGNDGYNSAGPDCITLRAPFLRFQTFSDAGVGDINNTAGSNDRMVVDPSGNVGIGSTAPAYTLDVSGTMGASTSITSPNFYGYLNGNISGNATYANSAGAITTTGQIQAGTLYLAGNTSNYIYVGTPDTYNPTGENNLMIQSWWGIGFKSYDGVVRAGINTRSGNANFSGDVTVNNLIASYFNGYSLGWTRVPDDDSGGGGPGYNCGYIRLPGGLIMQWGTKSSQWPQQQWPSYIIFPITFPTAALICLGCSSYGSASGPGNLRQEGCQFSAGGNNATYIAIGY